MSTSPTPRGRAAWSTGAKRAFREVLEANPGIDKARLTALYGACDLLSLADEMEDRVKADGYVAAGSQGQPVAHPLIAEVRQFRRGGLDTIRALDLSSRSGASSAGAALAGKRWSSRPPGGVTSIREAPSAVYAVSPREGLRSRLTAPPSAPDAQTVDEEGDLPLF